MRAAVDRTPQPCLHPNSHHEHGQRVTYVRDRCRCEACTAANTAYEDQRHRSTVYGRESLVDARPTRDHLRRLMAAGIGHKRVADLAGISRGVVEGVLYGHPALGRGPSRRIRPKAAAALLAVSVPTKAPAALPVTWRPKRLALGAPDPNAPPPTWALHLDDLDPGMPWESAALCAQIDPDEWFPDKGQNTMRVTQKVCRRCPVQAPCLDLALRTGDQFGVYGGMNATTRRKHPDYRPPTDWVKEHRLSVVSARHGAGWTDTEIGAELGLTAHTVALIRREHDIGFTPRKASA